MTRRARAGALVAGLLLACGFGLTSAVGPAGASATASWPVEGQNVMNPRAPAAETAISTATVGNLKVKWSLTPNGDVPDTPAVANGVAYFTDHGSATAPSTL